MRQDIPPTPALVNLTNERRDGSDAHASSSPQERWAGKFGRKYTGKSDWDEAKAVAAQWEAARVWGGDQRPEPPTSPAAQDIGRIIIERAVKTFTAEFEEHAASNTQKKYRLLLAKLKAFGDKRGYIRLDQWTPIDVREMRSAWSVSPQTAAKNMSTVKAFFEYCVANEWLSRNPARLVKNQRSRDAADRRNEQKLPFSDDELRRMYEACETAYGKQEIAWSRTIHHLRAKGEYARYNRKWTGQDLADFISVSVYTGLRISDVCTFRVDRMLATGEILLRTTKAGTHVLYVGSSMASGTHPRPRQGAWSVHLWRALHSRHERHHRCLAPEVKEALGPLRPMEGKGHTAQVPAYLRAHPVRTSRCNRARCGRATRQLRADGSEALRSVDTRAPSETYEGPEGCVRRQAQTKTRGYPHAPLSSRVCILCAADSGTL